MQVPHGPPIKTTYMKNPDLELTDEYTKCECDPEYIKKMTDQELVEYKDSIEKASDEWSYVGRYGNTWEDFAFGTVKRC